MTSSLGTVTLTVALAASIPIASIPRVSLADASAGKPKARTDALGDPLPTQAVARLGSRRLNHGSSVDHVVLSSDGKWVVSSSWDGNRLWDAATGREQPLRAELKQAAIFATRDKLVAVAKEKRDLQLWDVMSGKKIGGLLPAAKVGDLAVEIHFGRHYGYSPLALSPDGRTLVICNFGMGKRLALRFCDVARGQVEPPIHLKADLDKSIAPARMVFSAEGKTLVVHCIGKGYSAVHIWDVARRKEQIVSRSGLKDYAGQIALSPDGRILVTVPNRVRLWDTGTLKELLPSFEAPKEDLIVIAISPDGKQLAVSNRSSTVRLLDLATRKEVRHFQGKGWTIYHMAFSADGKYLVAGDGVNVTFWDVATGKYRHDFWHTDPINSVAFSADGKRLVSGADSIVRVWDPLTGKQTSHLRGHTSQVAVVAYSPDGKLIASAGLDTAIRLWDTATSREIRRLETEDGYFDAMVFVSNGKTLASVGGRHLKLVHHWDVATGRKLRTFKIPYALTIFSPDGKTLATHGYRREDRDIQLWDVAKGESIRQLAGPKAIPPRLAFSPDGKTLAASSIDGSVHLWDVLSGEQRRPLADPLGVHGGGSAQSIAFSPDGRSLAAGYGFFSGQEEEGCMVRLWELSSGHVRLRYDRQGSLSHRRGIWSLAFSPDSTLLATGGYDRTILIWDMTGQRTTHLPSKDRFRPTEGEALWNELGDADAAKAYRAMQTLFAAPEQAVSLSKQRLHPAAAVDARRIERLIADLDNDRFDVRDNADRELRKVVDDAEPALRKVLAGKPSLEQRLRVQRLLQVIGSAPSPERLRELRAVEVLERIGSIEAQQVLKMLAQGDPQAQLTHEAKAAQQRVSTAFQKP